MNLPPNSPASRVWRKVVRVSKADSAFLYALMESYGGIASYSTLDHTPGDHHRDLELWIPDGFKTEMDRLLLELGPIVYTLEEQLWDPQSSTPPSND